MRNPRNEASPARRILDPLQRNPRLVFWFRTGSNVDRRMAEALIEEGTTHVLKNGYSVRWDKGRQPGQQDHLHVRRNGRDVAITIRTAAAATVTTPHGSGGTFLAA